MSFIPREGKASARGVGFFFWRVSAESFGGIPWVSGFFLKKSQWVLLPASALNSMSVSDKS